MTATPTAPDRYKVTRKRVSSLRPSPENDQLYHPIERGSPDFVALVKSIKREGLHEPLLVTADNYLVSGHRRHAALEAAGQQFAPCRVLDKRRRDMPTDEFIALLRDHNRQRHKSVAEQLRETLVDLSPEQSHRQLIEARIESECRDDYNGICQLSIEGKSQRYRISDQKAKHVEKVMQVIMHDRRSYWPLSVRGVHYALLNYRFKRNTKRGLYYRNDQLSYQATSDLLTRLRINGQVPWHAIDDGTRPTETFNPFRNVSHFIRQEVDDLFVGYWRNLLQTQPNHVEVLVEKNTVLRMALRVTRDFQIPTSSGRGFSSIDAIYDIAERHRRSGRKRLILIVLSDFDPEGEMIPHTAGRILRDDFGIEPTIIKCGVTREQIGRYELQPMAFAKESSSNRQRFIDRNHGDDTVYELEALDPDDMLRDLRETIEGVIDVDLFNAEIEREKAEAAHLEAARRTAREALRGLGQ